ncbi:hypothetical protein LX32DRAFT_287629 [Colletotrichum zoysiae]|uniref:Uncharacterized protein n=1 Tax=Colletotrichum zoysiae TaxID=1216348 RepID=A0AAD9HNE5_9PEZI|nr:hypothetical protein LX32DRAFT_287629 [Colletotrichum zoysiae]
MGRMGMGIDRYGDAGGREFCMRKGRWTDHLGKCNVKGGFFPPPGPISLHGGNRVPVRVECWYSPSLNGYAGIAVVFGRERERERVFCLSLSVQLRVISRSLIAHLCVRRLTPGPFFFSLFFFFFSFFAFPFPPF